MRPGLADEVPGAVVLEVTLLLRDVDVHARSGPAGAGGSS
jgi:hypothetical protein